MWLPSVKTGLPRDRFRMKIWFVVPPNPRPSGGVTKLLEFADSLRNDGRDTEVLCDAGRSLRPGWVSDRQLRRPEDVCLKSSDLLVLPEFMADKFAEVRGIHKIIANQNTFMAVSACYEDEDVIGHLVVSEYSRQHVSRMIGHRAVWRVRHGIDHELFRPAERKRRVVAYMPRKMPHHLRDVITATARDSDAAASWEFVAIDGMPRERVATVLGQATVFLSTSTEEGFGLPPAEAMACGAYVVGYAGQAGREFLLPEHATPVAEGDVVAFIDATLEVLRAATKDPAPFLERGRAAARFVSRNYTMSNQRSDLLKAFSEAEELRPPARLEEVGLPRLRGRRFRTAGYLLRESARVLVRGVEASGR